MFQNFNNRFGTATFISSFATKFGAGAFAGVTAATLTYPLDTIRARLAFQVTGEHKYKGIVDAGTTIFRTVSGFFQICELELSFLSFITFPPLLFVGGRVAGIIPRFCAYRVWHISLCWQLVLLL